MTDRNLRDAMQQYRRHLAHQRRELYEHNVDQPCPCENCERERFEHRFVVIALFLLSIACGFGAMLLGAWP